VTDLTHPHQAGNETATLGVQNRLVSLIAPTLGSCFGTVIRNGVHYPCPRIVIWRGTLKTTRNGLSWEADACEHHGLKLMGRFRITSQRISVSSSSLTPSDLS
jgi:hypothetical protein